MSPEQLRGEETDARSDAYSLGCVLYACLAGASPFHRDTPAATITAQLHDPPPSVSQTPGVPKQFDAVIKRALAKRPRDRYASAGALGTAALAAVQGRGSRSWRSAGRTRQPNEGSNVTLRPVPTPPADQQPTRVGEPTNATVVRDDVETRVGRTAVMPPPPDATQVAPRPRLENAKRSVRKRPYLLVATALVVAALVAGVIALAGGGRSQPSGPLTGSEITAAVDRFATDYSRHDVSALARLLSPDVTRVDPSSDQHGRAAVLHEYETQFKAKPVPIKYAVSHLSVITGWAGRAQADYTLTLTGGTTASGHVVFGVRRNGDRVQVELISTE